MLQILKMVSQRLGLGLITLFVVSVIIFVSVELLPGDLAEAIRIGLSESELSDLKITASLGVSSIKLGANDPQELLDQADFRPRFERIEVNGR